MLDPKFPGGALDRYKTEPPDDIAQCQRCGCVQGMEPVCDKLDLCACHFSARDRDAMAADAMLDALKEDDA